MTDNTPESAKAFSFWPIGITARLGEARELPSVECFGATITWLLAEGCIRGRNLGGQDIYDQVSLTSTFFPVSSVAESRPACTSLMQLLRVFDGWNFALQLRKFFGRGFAPLDDFKHLQDVLLRLSIDTTQDAI